MGLGERVKEKAVCRPEGVIGRLGGRMMALDKELPAWVLNILEIEPSDSIVEIGSGPGVAVALASELAYEGRVVGVDPSETMLDMARRRNKERIEENIVEFHRGTAEDLPFDDDTFDAAMTINSLHLWSDPVEGLEEVSRTMKPASRIAVSVSRFSYASSDEFDRYLAEAGFERIATREGDRGICLVGEN